MRPIFQTIIATLALFAGSCTGVKPQTEEVIADGFRFNESTLPYDGGILVANFGCSEFNSRNNEGLGYVAYLKDGVVSTLIPADGSLSAPKGMAIKDNYLLLCDVNMAVVYNLDNLDEPSQKVVFPEEDIALNDMVVVGDTIYVSVTNSGNIFTLDGSNMATIDSVEPLLWANVEGANGMAIYEKSLYICSFPVNSPMGEDNVIYKIDNLDTPNPQKLLSKSGKWDGIALSEDGSTLYAGDWNMGGIIAYDMESGTTTELEFDYQFSSPADFSLVGNTLYIPDMLNSTLVIKALE